MLITTNLLGAVGPAPTEDVGGVGGFAIVTSKKHPEMRNRYLALRKRRGHKKAIIAIARMLLTAIFAILKKDEPYNPMLYKTGAPPKHRDVTVE